MGFKISVETNINIPANLAKVKNPKFWEFGASEYHRLLTPYVPMETGALSETVDIKGESGSGYVEYTSPYAHYQYEGRAMGPSFYNPDFGFWSPPGKPKHYTGKSLNYDKSRHPKACAKWDKVAEPTEKPKLIQAMQGYVDSGRLNL